MWPPSRMCGRQRRVIRISPATFVAITVASSSSVDSSTGYAAERQAGVVEEDVEPAELVHRRRDEALAALHVGDVELERDVRIDPLDAPRSARDADPLGAKVSHDGRADPARGTRDDRGLAFETHRASLMRPGACST